MTAEPGSDISFTHGISFGEAARVWLQIGLNSFGGPAGQIAVMHRTLVGERRWVSEERFLHALNYCMLLPGPEAQQLTVYLGWLLHGYAGGLVAGTLFVLPGALAMLGLSLLYATFATVAPVAAALAGVKAAVLAVVVEAVIRIGRRALRNGVMKGLAAASFVAIFFFGVPFPLLILAAGAVGLAGGWRWPEVFAAKPAGAGGDKPGDKPVVDALLDRQIPAHTVPSVRRALGVLAIGLPLWLGPVAVLWAWRGPEDVYVKLGAFFSQAAVVTFGGAYAVLAHVGQQAVEVHGWLEPQEMLDGLGLAETTPGPLILVLQHVAFLAAWRNPGDLPPWLAGTLGAGLCLWTTFAPCFLWIFLGAPWVERLRQSRLLSAALSSITAAVVGVVLNLAVWFALHVLFTELRTVEAAGMRLLWPVWGSVQPGMALIAAGAMVAVLRFHAGMLPVLAGSALAGLAGSWAAGWLAG